MAKVLFVMAKNGFRDIEFITPSEILAEAGHEIFTASNDAPGKSAFGADGSIVEITRNIGDAKPEEFDLVVFVGGPGALENLDNETGYRLAGRTLEAGKPLGAICIAPMILAKAGILNGKKATVWSSPADREPIEVLKRQGAIYTDQKIVKDGNIITANGPAAAEEFGRELADLLKP